MSELSLIGSREVARLVAPLGLTMVAFGQEPGAPRALLTVGKSRKGKRFSRQAVLTWVTKKLAEAQRESVRQEAAQQALEVLG